MSPAPVRLDRDGAIGVLTIDNPPLNLIWAPVLRGLTEALRKIEGAGELRALVLTGAGERAFCAGADLGEDGAGSGTDPEPDRQLYDAVQRLPIPVVAAIKGHCVGGGLELALACDVRIAAEDAKLCAAGVTVGLLVSATRLATLVSPAVASDLVLSGRGIDGREAERLGVVSRAAPPDAVLAEACERAEIISMRAPLAVAAAKRAIGDTTELGFDAALAREIAVSAELIRSEDHRRAVEAFFRREQPQFRGA